MYISVSTESILILPAEWQRVNGERKMGQVPNPEDPHNVVLEGLNSAMLKKKVLSVKCDLNHPRDKSFNPLMPSHCSKQDVKMVWSTVSNVPLRTRSAKWK